MFRCAQCARRIGGDPFVCAGCGKHRDKATGVQAGFAGIISAGAFGGAVAVMHAYDRGAALIFSLPMIAIAVMCFAFLLPFPYSRNLYRGEKWGLAFFALMLVGSAILSI